MCIRDRSSKSGFRVFRLITRKCYCKIPHLRACLVGYYSQHSLSVNLLTRLPILVALASSAVAASYDDLIYKDKPVSYWNSNPADTEPSLQGGATIGEGPRPPQFPMFGDSNHAIVFG